MTHVVIFILLICFFATALHFIPFFKNIKGLSYRWLLAFFLLKIASSQIFIFIYTHVFDPATADLHRFFNESLVFYNIWQQNPADFFRLLSGNTATYPHLAALYTQLHLWHYAELTPLFNDNKIVIGFHALANLFTSASLHSNAVIANFVSIAGLTAFYKFGLFYVARKNMKWLKYGIFLFPSLLFWGSGLTKEIFLVPALGYFMYSLGKTDLQMGHHLQNWFYLALSTIPLLLIKTYVLILLIPLLAAWVAEKNMRLPVRGLWFFVIPFAVLMLVWIMGIIFPDYDFLTLIARRQNFFMNYALWVNAGSIIHEVFLQPNIADLALYAPRAFFNVLVFPHVFQELGGLSIYAAIENLVIIALLACSLGLAVRQKGLDRTQWLCLGFFVIFYTFLGTVNQVSGTLVRLKIPALPFLWILFVSLFPAEKMEKRISTLIGRKQ